jgi:nitrogenase subunit NifH
MSAKTTAILGKGGAGKTLVAAHLAMAFNYLGVKTLLIGCDQKQDTVRAVTHEERGSLMEALETKAFEYGQVRSADVIVPVTEYLDVLELGPSPVLVGNYAAVLDEAFHWFRRHDLLEPYAQVLFDVTDERWDAVLAPLFRRVHHAVAVTRENTESLFVINRLVRAIQIGAVEMHHPLTLVGLINNGSRDPLAFERYLEHTRLFPLLTIPDLPELASLKAFHRTLFTLKTPNPGLQRILDGFVKIAELLRRDPLNLYTVSTLPDDQIWHLAPAVSLPS